MLLRDLVSLQSSIVNLFEEIWGSYEERKEQGIVKRSQAIVLPAFVTQLTAADGR